MNIKINQHWIYSCIYSWCGIVAVIYSWNFITFAAAVVIVGIGIFEMKKGFDLEAKMKNGK